MSSLIGECYRLLTEGSSIDKPLKGYKVTNVNRSRKIGVACHSLEDLKRKACTKLNITDDLKEIGIFLLDGSEIDDAYFTTLEPQTTLILRRPGERILTEADILYQMLRKVNESLLQDGEQAAEFLTDKLKIKVAVLNKALNNDDKKTKCSKRIDHPEWFEGLDTNSSTKEACMHRRCQDRIRGYLYKTIDQIRASEVYLGNTVARKRLQRVIVFFKLQLRKDHFFGHYFDRSWAVKLSTTDNETEPSDDELDSADDCSYLHCPCKLSMNDYERYIFGINNDEVDAKKLVQPKDPSMTNETEKDEFQKAEETCPYKIISRSKEDLIALCDRTGEFRCKGVWKNDKCMYADNHKINPYRSKEELVLFSTWNLDHKIERSRTLVPNLLEASKRSEIKEDVVREFYDNLFTVKNLRLVHIVCHDKGSHK